MQVTQLTEMVARLTQLRLDHTEYTCLKALVLFKPEVVGLKQGLQVEVLQDQTHLMLQVCRALNQKVFGHWPPP